MEAREGIYDDDSWNNGQEFEDISPTELHPDEMTESKSIFNLVEKIEEGGREQCSSAIAEPPYKEIKLEVAEVQVQLEQAPKKSIQGSITQGTPLLRSINFNFEPPSSYLNDEGNSAGSSKVGAKNEAETSVNALTAKQLAEVNNSIEGFVEYDKIPRMSCHKSTPGKRYFEHVGFSFFRADVQFMISIFILYRISISNFVSFRKTFFGIQ